MEGGRVGVDRKQTPSPKVVSADRLRENRGTFRLVPGFPTLDGGGK
jgi:hypothetical protein